MSVVRDFIIRAASRPLSPEMMACVAFLAGVSLTTLIFVAGRA